MVDFDPQAGREQQKRRPALVISDLKFNQLGLTVICPITSRPARHDFHIALPEGLRTSGNVMTEQIKSLDLTARRGEFIEAVPAAVVYQIRRIVAQFI